MFQPYRYSRKGMSHHLLIDITFFLHIVMHFIAARHILNQRHVKRKTGTHRFLMNVVPFLQIRMHFTAAQAT
jgi:hypothetical protein